MAKSNVSKGKKSRRQTDQDTHDKWLLKMSDKDMGGFVDKLEPLMKKASKQKEAEDYRFAWYSDVVEPLKCTPDLHGKKPRKCCMPSAFTRAFA